MALTIIDTKTGEKKELKGRGSHNTRKSLENKAIGTGKPLNTNGEAIPSDIAIPRNAGKGGPRNEHGLTSRQESFAREVGMNAKTFADAYRAAYGAERMKPTTIYAEASALANNPLITKRIDYYARRKHALDLQSGARIRSLLIENLLHIAEGDYKASDRLKALELLGKLDTVQAFKERVETSQISDNPDEVRTKIAELLEKAKQSA